MEGEPLILSAPTGSGKTALARAAAHKQTVTALCQTKALQAENYGATYGFDVLFGRGNYPCAVDDSLTGSECEYAERGRGMGDCPEADSCEYLLQKATVLGSRRRSLNYAYWLHARGMRKAPTDYLFCDEAHLISETVLNFTGTTITVKQRGEWELPRFPNVSSSDQGVLFPVDATGEALKWLTSARGALLKQYRYLDTRKGKSPSMLRRLRRCERLGMKVRMTIEALRAYDKDWYIMSGPRARKARGKAQPGFVCKPLTARYHAPGFFLSVNGRNTVLMSATIGDPEAFAAELGIGDRTNLSVESQWGPETRPVIVPRDAPKLGRAAQREGPYAYDKQADIIAELVRGVPAEWSGVIHHTSIAGSEALCKRLARRGLGKRLWLPPKGVGTETQMAAWGEHRRRVPNALAIAWFWHTGVDLLEERICLVAKTPFPVLADGYERARLKYDGKHYLQRTAQKLVQACGRTRRGREQDYDTGGKRRGLVAIVDGNYRRCQKYLSSSFRDSIVEV